MHPCTYIIDKAKQSPVVLIRYLFGDGINVCLLSHIKLDRDQVLEALSLNIIDALLAQATRIDLHLNRKN